ncbi:MULTISPECIES: hypothetical protein [unclassified Shewanella]|uniref:hypothetical protein n=1 Tax=unclassified Shewanella TaxID=196818 RepID=UPI001F52D018|nr:hypothetical protein [Shewanella sp. 10N.286.48.A6]
MNKIPLPLFIGCNYLSMTQIWITSLFSLTLFIAADLAASQPKDIAKAIFDNEPISDDKPTSEKTITDKKSPLNETQSDDEVEPSACYSRSQTDEKIDKAFDYLNTKFCQPAIWFDSFFVDDRIEDDARAGTIVRWYNDFSYYEKEGFKYHANVNARVNLPGVTKKLKLIFDSTGEDDPFSFIRSPDDNNDREFSLRYDWLARNRSSFNIKLSFKPKIEARYRYTYPISENTISRITQKLYQEKNLTGESTEFDIEHSFNDDFLLRWSAAFQYETNDNGWELGSGLQLYQYISDKQAISYQAHIHGVDQPYKYIDSAKIGLTYRQNFVRDWLFFAITPEYTWTKEDDEVRINQVVLTFTIEFLFQNI